MNQYRRKQHSFKRYGRNISLVNKKVEQKSTAGIDASLTPDYMNKEDLNNIKS